MEEEKRIPKEVWLDMEELIDYGQVAEVDHDYETATKYISVERLWHHAYAEEPKDGALVLAELKNTGWGMSKYVVCKYSARRMAYETGYGYYSDPYVSRWYYLEDVEL